MKTTVAVAILVLALSAVGTAFGATFSTHTLSDAHVGKSKPELQAQIDYSTKVEHFIKAKHHWMIAARHADCWSHVPWAQTCNRARQLLAAHHWLRVLAERRMRTLYPPPLSAPDAWYADGATQCEVSHEGWFTTDSNPTYKGRFQMDYSFETSTPFGLSMERLYGRANNWPPEAQIQHAYEVWTSRGWSPWPPYYKYGCANWHGRTYH